MGYIASRVNMWEEEIYKSKFRPADEKEDIPPLNDRYSSQYYINQMKSSNPCAVLKVLSNANNVGAVNRIMDYIARDISKKDREILLKNKEIDSDEKFTCAVLSIEDDNGIIYSNKAQRRALIRDWSRDFRSKDSYKKQEWKIQRLNELKEKRLKLSAKAVMSGLNAEEQDKLKQIELDIKRKKTKLAGKEYNLALRLPGDTRHIILSVGGNPKTEKDRLKATIAVRQFLSDNIGSLGHKYIFVAHNDTDNLHYHVLIKVVNEIDGRNLHFDKADLFAMRQSFARELSRAGIERVAVKRLDKTQQLEKIYQGTQRLSDQKSWYKAQMSKDSSVNFDAYEYRAKLLRSVTYLSRSVDYQLKNIDNKSKDKKQLTKTKNILTQHKKTLLHIKPKELKAQQIKVINHLEKDSKFIVNKIKKITGYDKESLSAQMLKQRQRRAQMAGLYLKKHQESINKAYQNISAKGLKQELKKLLVVCTSYGKSIKSYDRGIPYK